MVTRFELGDRFVELSLEGATLHRRWGVTGRVDLARDDTYANEAEAALALRRQLRRFEHRGYRAGRRNPTLEAVMVERPDDVNAYLVYADWLQEQNDPRGELIATMAAGKPHDALLAANATQFIPPIRAKVDLHWELGFVREADFWGASWTNARRLLRHPSALVLRSLGLRQYARWADGNFDSATLVPLLPRTLARIEVDEADVLWTSRDRYAPELRRLLVPVPRQP